MRKAESRLTFAGSSNANEVLQISIVRAGSKAPEKLSTFHPQFTYPIFGEQERIFGYQGLHIKFRFAAHDLRPNVEISYDRKFKAVGDTKPTDILGTLKEWIPEGTVENERKSGKISDFSQAASINPLLSMRKSRRIPQPGISSPRVNILRATQAKGGTSRYGVESLQILRCAR